MTTQGADLARVQTPRHRDLGSAPTRIAPQAEGCADRWSVAMDGAATAADESIAFDALYRSIAPRLLRFVRRAEPCDAEDIAADVWLAMARYVPRFRGDRDGFEALAFTIARRRITDQRRRRAFRRTDAVGHERLAERSNGDRPDAEAIDSLRTREVFERLFRLLPQTQAEVVVLRLLHDLSVEQVAGIVGRSPGAVRLLQHRAMRRLRA